MRNLTTVGAGLRMRWRGGAVFLTISWFAVGCAAIGNSVSRSSVTGGLQSLDEVKNRRAAEAVMTSPEIREGVRQLAMSGTDGILTRVGERAQTPEAEEAWRRLASTFSAALDREMTPRVEAWTATAIRSGLDEATGRESREALAQLTGVLTRAVEREFARGIREDLAPALHDALQGELRDVLISSSADVAHGIVAGMHRAEDEQAATNPNSASTQLRALLRRSRNLALLAGIALLVLVAGFVFRLVRTRERREQITPIQPAVTPETLRPLIVSALREILRDPASAEAFARDLRRPDNPAPH